MPSCVGTLAPGATKTCYATRTITQADIDAGIYTNSATATGTAPDSSTVSDTGSVSVDAAESPALTLTKTTTDTTYSTVGKKINYTITLTNSGNVTLTDVGISDALVSDLSCTPSQPAASLAPGASLNCTASYTTKLTDLDAGSVVNTATASGTDTKSNAVNSGSA